MKIVEEITAEHVAYWVSDAEVADVQVVKFAAPPGMTDCRPCQSVVTTGLDGAGVVRTPWQPSPQDLAALAAGGTVWLSTWGGLPPHMLEVQPVAPLEPDPAEIQVSHGPHPLHFNTVVVPSPALVEREPWNRWAPCSYLGWIARVDDDGRLVIFDAEDHEQETFAPGDWSSVTTHAPSGAKS